MAYSYLTLSGLQTQISERLDDPNNVHWSAAEILLYTQEALRMWQSVTGYWRGRMIFNTAASQIFYDLTAQTGTLIPMTLTDQYFESVMAYHLLEGQPAAGVWNGTDMFSIDDFTQALQRRRDQFLVETGMITTRSLINWPSPPISQRSLTDVIIDVRRAAWINAAGVYSNLWRSNEWGASAFNPNWNLTPTDPPQAYSVAAEPPVTLQVIPPPQNPGQVELIAVQAGAPLNPAAGVALGIPDNLSWIVKWGALADLLTKAGQAEDLQRASYCEQRWREGIGIARIHTSIVQAAINGQFVFVNALESLDAFSPGWQNTAAGLPTAAALASWNLMALSGPPNAGPYGIQLDVVQNAPVPVLAGDLIQVGREDLDSVIGYIVHLAMFKLGGNDFLNTSGLYDNLLKAAGTYNERLQAQVDFSRPMSDRAIRNEILVPRRVPVEQAQGG